MKFPNLNDDALTFYRDKGYVILNPMFPAGLLDRARADIVGLLEQKRARLILNDRRIRETEVDLHFKSQAVKELITSRVFEDVCKAMLGGNIDLRFCFTLTKTAEHGGPVDWHQDGGLDKDQGHPRISFWIAITESNLRNGCIRIIPGSHKDILYPHSLSDVSPPDLGIKDVDVRQAIPLEMQPGEVLIIHPQVIHGSASCTSSNARVAVLGSFQVPKKSYNEFWAKAGARFLRNGMMDWSPLEISSET